MILLTKRVNTMTLKSKPKKKTAAPVVVGSLPRHSWRPKSGVVACTCNPATMEAEFRNGVGSMQVEDISSSIGECIVGSLVIQHKERNLTKYWDSTRT